MNQIQWKQKMFVDGKLIAEIDRVNTIDERRSFTLFTPELERKRFVIEFVEPGVWCRVK